MKPIAQPRSAEWIVGCFLPAEERDAVLGDLLEERAVRAGSQDGPNATLWYWRQILRSITPLFWLALRRGRWLEILGAALAAYLLVKVMQTASAIAISKVVFTGPIAYGVTSLTIALAVMILGGYIAARMRRGAPVLLAIISGVMVLHWIVTAGAKAPFLYQLLFLVSCPLSAVVGGALLRRRVAVIALMTLVIPATASSQARQYALESASGLTLHNVAAEPATLNGKKGVRLTLSAEGRARLQSMTAEQQNQFEQLAVIDGTAFSSGVIEAEIAGALAPDAGAAARGFVGIAFRLQNDMRTYDSFYLRPTNGRAEDQERRNHTAQYISHPDWPWFRLRSETPSKYESYVDLVPGEWTKIRIEVRGDKARLFVHGQEHPTLIVNDVKSGAEKSGAVALWLGPGTVAHFRNLTVSPAR